MYKPPRKYVVSVITVWLATALLTLACHTLMIRPAGLTLASAQKQLAELEQKFRRAREVHSEQVKKQLDESLAQTATKVKSFITNTQDTAALMFSINQAASDLKVSNFTSQSAETQSNKPIPGCENLRETSIDIAFVSDFPSFAGFINSLERNTPCVFIENFDIKRPSNEKSGCEAKVSLAFYVPASSTGKTL